MAAVNVLYNVGSRDENRQLTGMAHLFEHLMFGGSVNVPSFDAELEGAGGKSNAWTSSDFTNFYDVLPHRISPLHFTSKATACCNSTSVPARSKCSAES